MVEQHEAAPLTPGVPVELSPWVRRLLAPNPGMMTGPGTNTYLVGHDDVIVVDPGPVDDAHLGAILAAGGGHISHIVCTHTHPDHWPGSAALAAATGVAILAFEDRDGLVCDRHLADGDVVVTAEGLHLRAVHTPGHAGNHLCYLLEEEGLLFTGDHLMQGSTVVISPPDGDMAAYLSSLARLRTLQPPLRALAPGHGHVLDAPLDVVDATIAHRIARETKVHERLAASAGDVTVDELVPAVYDDVHEALHPVARRSLWAHLRKLHGDGEVTATDVDDVDTGRWTSRPAPVDPGGLSG